MRSRNILYKTRRGEAKQSHLFFGFLYLSKIDVMIYLENDTIVQRIFIPRESVNVEMQISSAIANAYQEGYEDGFDAAKIV